MTEKTVIGRTEWVALPELNLPPFVAKIDTGAHTNVLHCKSQEVFEKNGQRWVRVQLEPNHQEGDKALFFEAPISREATMRSSNGAESKRYFINTQMLMGGQTFSVELSFTGRKRMRYPMLVGCTALAGRFVVDVAQNKTQPKPSRS